MPISISKSPNWTPGKGFTFSNQHGGTGGMSMGGGATPPAPVVVDNYTKMLMHFDDDAAATTFADAAQSPLTQTKFGTVATSTAQSKFGGKSLALNGTNTNKLQFANPKGKAMDLSNQPFCVEGWFYLNNFSSSGNWQGLLTFANSDSGDFQGPIIGLDPSNRFQLYMTTNGTSWDLGSPTIQTTQVPALNSWFHIALMRETTGGDIKFVYNGTVVGTKATSASLYTGDYFYAGRTNYINGTRMDGYIDDVRVVVGSCPYSAAAFVVPTAELTAIANTKVLLKGANVTKDDSSLNLYTQALGSAASSTVQSKFGGSSIKIASATGDFIKVYNNTQPLALLDRPFTIEGWFWLNANNVGYQPLIMTRTAGLTDGPVIYMEQNNTLYAQMSNAGGGWDYPISTGFTPSANAWHHVALVREYKSGPIKLYCDGMLRGSNATTASVFTGENIFIGHYPNFGASQQTLNGYIDEVRITLDYCAYNGNFTPAAAPFTDGKNLLLHFDGANNSTTMTDSSTYGKTATAYDGAVISTTKSKFGGSSLYTTGTGSSRVQVNSSSDFAFGTGDFTIEYWMNMSSLSAGASGYHSCMIDTRVNYGSTSGLFFGFNPSRKIIAWAGSIFLTSNSTIPLDTWKHIALVKKGTNVYLYIDGVLDASVSSISLNLSENGLMIGNHYLHSSMAGVAFNGYIDELRITKGTALYAPSIGDTTAPTAQLSASANTKLMLNFNSDSSDSSTNPATVTAYGGAVLSSAQSKFGGNSMKFTRSTGSRLTVSNVGNKLQFGSSDFCVETWMNLSSMPGGTGYPAGFYIFTYGADSSADGFDYFIDSTNICCGPVSGNSLILNVAHGMTTNTWYHVALSRNGGNLNVFINGVLKGTAAISGAVYTIPSTGANANLIAIGAGEPMAATAGNFDGYMDDFRITIGEPVYLPNPSTPFTLIG